MQPCPQCNRGTCIAVTTQNKTTTREHQGLLLWIVTAPWRVIKWIFRFGVAGKKTEFHKQTHWHCTSCGHQFPQVAPATAVPLPAELPPDVEEPTDGDSEE